MRKKINEERVRENERERERESMLSLHSGRYTVADNIGR